MISKLWRLSEAGESNLGLACTEDGLVLGRTPLIERYAGRFIVRDRWEIARLLGRAYRTAFAVDRLMPGLATVASAMNANDPCLARIAAVHLRIPDMPSQAARGAMEAEDILIKIGEWNPALHPRAGTPPNPGWFATTAGVAGESSPIRTAQNDNPRQRRDTSSDAGNDWVKVRPGNRIEELADFLEWIANATPEDEKAIRAEIKRYYYDVGDIFGGEALNRALSDILEPGMTKQARQEVLNGIEEYANVDPAEMGQLRSSFAGAILSAGLPETPEALEEFAAASARSAAADLPSGVWKWGWARRGAYFDELLRDGSLPPGFPVIDSFTDNIAISVKSIDLNATTYQNAARLENKLFKYIDDLADYEGGSFANKTVIDNEIAGRTLKLVIPKGGMTEEQRGAIDLVREWAKIRNTSSVDLTVIEY